MLNCPECGLTITDAQEECPKCHTKIEDITREVEEEQQAKEVQKETKETKLGKRKKDRQKKTEVATAAETNEETTNTDKSKKVKEEMIKAVVGAEEESATGEMTEEDSAKLKEEMIAAVVEAEALAVIEGEEAAAEEENLCKTCMTPVDTGQNFCQLCGSDLKATSESVASIIPKSDEDANKWIAAVGYIVFFLPILFEFYRKSKFVKYHAKQAAILFIASTILFLVLVVFRNILDGLFTVSPMPNPNEIFTTADTSWRHGTGVLFQYYLTGMIYALHLMPFAFMITGFINSVQGEEKPLPLIGRPLKARKATK